MTKKRRSKPARRRSTKKKSNGLPSWLGKAFVTIAFLGMVGVAVGLFVFKDRIMYTGLTTDWVDSVLIAAQVDPETQKQVVIHEGTEKWKITVDSQDKKNAIIRALASGVESKGDKWSQGEETWRNGKGYHVVELPKEDGEPLRLIFEIAKRRPNLKKPTKPKVAPPVTAVADVPDPKDLIDTNVDAPLIAIILDDIGHKPVDSLRPVLDLKYPITFAVLPHLKYTSSSAMYLHQHQYEVMLHMPMEPDSRAVDPGKGAIRAFMSEGDITSAVNLAMDNVPFISGVNNHMGSKITARRSMMRPILNEIKDRKLFWIDSRTQSNTVAFKVAKDLGMRTAKRDIFLDSEMTYEFAARQLREARRVADKKGSAIVIGHPYPTSLQALADEMPKMNQEGYRFVFASKLVHEYSDQL